jgi:hypothetical protein
MHTCREGIRKDYDLAMLDTSHIGISNKEIKT